MGLLAWFTKEQREEVMQMIKNKEEIFYGFLGLSIPCLTDYVTKKKVSFALKTNEEKALLNELSVEDKVNLIEEAKFHFADVDFVFYKNSRWTNSAILRSLNPNKVLTDCLNDIEAKFAVAS